MRKRNLLALLLALCLSLCLAVNAEQEEITLYARNAIVINGETGEEIYALNADERVYPASTTKILTVLLGILTKDEAQVVTISEDAVRLPSDAVRIGLKAGEKLTFGELLTATLVKSGNDGANAIAEAVSGDAEAFARLMNGYTAAIGCTDTHFVNPSGLHDENHYTTPRDMAKIAFEAMQFEEFRDRAARGRYTLKETNKSAVRTLSSHGRNFFANAESEYYFKGANGIKTGYTKAAGYCFVSGAERDGKKVIVCVFGCGSYGQCFRDAKKLFLYAFDKM